jgi:hypothetical protein
MPSAPPYGTGGAGTPPPVRSRPQIRDSAVASADANAVVGDQVVAAAWASASSQVAPAASSFW